MLRLSYYRSDDGEQWIFCGQLSGASVEELRSVWRRIRQQRRRTNAVIDLRQVSFIDEAGEQLLAEMKNAGADFVVTGVEQKRLLANLRGEGAGAVGKRIEQLGGERA